MSHESMRKRLFEASTPMETREAEAHLAACPACRAEAAEWRMIASALFRKPAVQPSESFVRGVMDKVAAEPPREDFFERLRAAFSTPRPVLAGLTAAALAVLILSGSPRRAPDGAVRDEPDAPTVIGDAAELFEDPSEEDASLGTSVEDYFL